MGLVNQEENSIEITVSESHLVTQDAYFTLVPGDRYTSSQLTSCAMVFALSGSGSCVYHWPGHDDSSLHANRMATAMREAQVGSNVRFKIFGYYEPISKTLDSEYLQGWKIFGEQIGELGPAEVFLSRFDCPSFNYDGETVTPRMPMTALSELIAQL